MTGRYTLSPRAQGDVDDIWDYSAKRWGVDQAEFYIRRLMQHIEATAAKPDIGRPCDLKIIRVLHERMDFDQVEIP